jgi:CDP-diacylglycerol--glycerol-3-phosphate 3-phosphatidyltransferase
MTLADKVTGVRLLLAPLFFIVYLLPEIDVLQWFPRIYEDFRWSVPVLWVLFVVSELTDLIDGKIARARHEVSDFGKLFDPFADVLVRITYFLCFVIDGILPGILFLVVLYREFGIQFLRNLMMKKKVVQGARWGGKIKAFAYMLAGAVALLASSVMRLNFDMAIFSILCNIAIVIFLISVVISVISFADYLFIYKNLGDGREG